MIHHSLNNNTCMGLVIPLCSNSNPLISLIPPKLPQILDIYSVVALYILCVIGKLIRMIMIELRMFSNNFAYAIFCIKRIKTKLLFTKKSTDY